MADTPHVVLAIVRGDHDAHLGDIAEALAQRQADLNDFQLAAAALAAYMELTGVSVAEVLELAEE